MPALAAGLSFLMNQKKGDSITALYPITKTENVCNADGTTLPKLLEGKAPVDHGNHVPTPEAKNDLKFLRCDNTWATVQVASTTAAGVVKLTDSTTLDDSTLAATAKAVKAAYDKASHEHPYVLESKLGVADGVATLDSTGFVTASQLPSYVDDVIEGEFVSESVFNNAEGTPVTPETGKIYVDTKTNLNYRWSGTQFTEISKSIALGITSSTAFRGDYGNQAYQHSLAEHARVDATKVEKSDQMGYIKVDGKEVLVYSHPGTGTNPHGTTAADVGLDKVENMSAAEIINTLTKEKIETIIGGHVATTEIATETAAGLMGPDHVKKLNACQRIYVQESQPAEDGLWFKTVANGAA